ncbi:MAG: NERD domain-containing protein [Chloroflexota bacterium]|nr:NERD domain-containing protein [Chloroflexota bacterium]
MQVSVNSGYVVQRRKTYRRTVAFQFALWFAVLLVWFLYPGLMPMTWPVLVIVFIASNFSRQLQFESGVPVPTEERLERALRPLSNRYWLGSYLQFGRQTVAHMLVGPEGVLVIEARNHGGMTMYTGGKWRRPGRMIQRILGVEPSVGDPAREVTGLVELVRGDLAEAGMPEVPISGAVVFTPSNASLQLENCPVTVMTAQQLARWASEHKLTGNESLIPEPVRHKVIAHYQARMPAQLAQEARAPRTST